MFGSIKKIVKFFACLTTAVTGVYGIVFFVQPSLVVDFYRSWNERDIFMEIRPFGIEKEISGTSHYKAKDAQWSPGKTYFSYFDHIQELAEKPFTREWALKIVDPRQFEIRTVFIGDYKISGYQWIDDAVVRVYVDAGTGVRIYRDIRATEQQPFIAADHSTSEYWIPEVTYSVPIKMQSR